MTARTFLRDDATFAAVAGSDLPREVLTGARTYYVRTDGADTNSGLVDSAGGAFLTGQKAIDTVQALDINGNAVKIKFGGGTYTGPIVSGGPFIGDSAKTAPLVTLEGDVTTPSNVVLQTTTASSVIQAVLNGSISVQGFKLQSSGGGALLDALHRGRIFITGAMEFGACNGTAQVLSRRHSHIEFISGLSYTVSGGGSTNHLRAANNAILSAQSLTITVTGTPTFSNFLGAVILSEILVNGSTWSGAIVGGQYDVESNSVINLSGAVPPGAGTTVASGGQPI